MSYPPYPQDQFYGQQPYQGQQPGFNSPYPPQQLSFPQPPFNSNPQQQQSAYPPYPGQQPQGYLPQQQQYNQYPQQPAQPTFNPYNQCQQQPAPTYQQGGYNPAPYAQPFAQQQVVDAWAKLLGQPAYSNTPYQQQPVQSYQQPVNQSTPSQVVNMQGTVRPSSNFNAQDDAKALKTAMKGFGCNKKAIIQILCKRTARERHQITLAFKTMYGKDLISELKSELRGDMEDVCVALCELPAVYDAKELHYAMEGIGTDEADLIEIMCTRSNSEIMEIKHAYQMLYRRQLEQNLKSETSYYFKRLMVSMCTGARDESNNTDVNRARNDANELVRAGVKKIGTDESAFMGILCMQNSAQLCLLFNEYKKLTNRDIEQDIRSEFSGDILAGLLTLVKCAKNTPAYYAERAQKAMAGLGTHDRDLIRICVTRCEKDMVNIKQEYARMYKKNLEQAIASETSGSYKDALITLIS